MGSSHYPGPLAGILAGLDWAAAHRPNAQWILSAPGDCPFLPRDLVARLRQAVSVEGAELAVAASQGRSHPVIGLWKVTLRDALREALVVEGLRKVQGWTERHRVATVAWPAEPLDPFFNINTIEDLAEAERLAALEVRPNSQQSQLDQSGRHIASRSTPERLFAQQGLSELGQLGKLLLLFGDPRRIQIVVAGARVGGGLFNQFLEILPDRGNSHVHFSQGQTRLHRRVPFLSRSGLSSDWSICH